MSNYLKKIIFTLFILMVPYMNSASNAGFGDFDEQRGNIAVKQSTSLRNMSREDWKPAIDAVSSSVWALAQVPFDLVKCAVNNPGKTTAFLGTCLFLGAAAETLGAAEAAEVAEIAGQCACFCWQGPRSFWSGVCANNAADCQQRGCKQLPIDRCVPNNMGCK